jgi:hypothetical protein
VHWRQYRRNAHPTILRWAPWKETLKQGRGLLWLEMHSLYAPIDQLYMSNPMPTEQFVGISRELEDITTSPETPERDSRGQGSPDDHQHADLFGQMMERVRTLEHEHGQIIKQTNLLQRYGPPAAT